MPNAPSVTGLITETSIVMSPIWARESVGEMDGAFPVPGMKMPG